MTSGRSLQSRRDGVVLLLVLAMLAMFAMLIATFMVVSSQQYRQAESVGKLDRYVHSPKDDIHSVVLQMLVGCNAKPSVIRYHSLGATEFSDPNSKTPGLVGRAFWDNASPYGASHEITRYFLDYSSPDVTDPDSIVDFLASIGNVFTVRNPNTLKWHSARIVNAGYDIISNGYYVDVRAFPGIFNPSVFDDTEFYINPPAFAGTGAGYPIPDYDTSDPIIDDMTAEFWQDYAQPRLMKTDEDNFPYAMQLNPNAPSYSGPQFGERLNNNVWRLNVDYTAPDAASPFLAWFDPDSSVFIPSYHRPTLVRHYGDFLTGSGEEYAGSLRKVVMRPMPFDHKDFDGSNPALSFDNLRTSTGTFDFAKLQDILSDPHGQNYLDVDTDGNGIKDAVWLDVGLPVRTDINGRTYKPLVAIKCIDLDGRLNVNAHGNFAEQWVPEMLGSGFGPAGVNLTRGIEAFTGGYLANPQIIELTDNLITDRYVTPNEKSSSIIFPKIAYQTPSDVPASLLAQFGGLPGFYPQVNDNLLHGVYLTASNNNGWYNWIQSSPDINNDRWWKALAAHFGNLPDLWDQANLDFDPLGSRMNSFYATPFLLTGYPVWEGPPSGDTFPYLFDPNRRTPFDQPFTLPELEAVLRQNDIDKDVLPSRLRNILGFVDPNSGFIDEPEVLKVAAYNVTTLSNDVPVPGPALADQGYASLYALIRSCVEKESTRLTSSLTLEQINNITLQLIEYLPEEIRQGGKINLNKLVEDPTMFLSADLAENFPADYDIALYERMKMARGIYIILMALSYDKLYGVPVDPASPNDYIVEPYIEPSFLQAKEIADLKGTNEAEFYRVCCELAATRLAQWAVNVVDFTDVDAIMTPFIFDVNPFDGNCWGAREPDIGIWNEFTEYDTKKSIAPYNYRLIWGLERPDLLLTETLAFHNRNVADTDEGKKALPSEYRNYVEFNTTTMQFEIVASLAFDDPARIDIETNYMDNGRIEVDYDQIRMPQGSAFLELYCAADPNRPYFPQEIFTGNQLDVCRVNGFNNPVWRVVVGQSNYTNGTDEDGEKRPKTESHMKYSILHRLRSHGPLFSFDPENPNILGDATPTGLKQDDPMIDPVKDHRIVWFAPMQPAADASGIIPENIYYNRTGLDGFDGEAGLAPNEYLVVGPRMETYLTSQRYGAAGTTFGKVEGCPKIELANLVKQNVKSASDFIGRPKYMVAAAEVDGSNNSIPGWTNTFAQTLWLGTGAPDTNTDLVGLGLSISEPLRSRYYKQPTTNSHISRNGIIDMYGASGSQDLEEPYRSTAAADNPPLSEDGLVGSGTAAYYKSAFLQRLADPLREWDAVTNPYITVDWNMFDLKVYSGEHAGGTSDNDNEETQIAYPPPLVEGEGVFCSSQWGVKKGGLIGGRPLPNPWDRGVDVYDDSSGGNTAGIFSGPNKIELWDSNSVYTSHLGMTEAIVWPDSLSQLVVPLPYQPEYTVPAGVSTDYGRKTLAFGQFPVHSLGRLGTDPNLLHPQLESKLTAPTILPMSLDQATALGINIAYAGAPIKLTTLPSSASNPPELWGTASDGSVIAVASFQHLPWHNGPLANSYEVMQVPASSPGRFGVEFADRGNDLDPNDPPYNTNYLLEEMVWDTPPAAGVPGVPNDAEKLPGSLGSNVRFGHLLNFQHAHGSWWSDWYDAHATAVTPTVPSFVSLDLANFLNFVNVPSRFVGTRDWYQDSDGRFYSFSRFREPGKVNLNTLTASGFAALMENRPYKGTPVSGDPQTMYEEFDMSRSAAPYRGASSFLLNFDNPYESAVNTSLLRGISASPDKPAFAPAIDDVNNLYPSDNTYTALEGIQRLSDMTTTRSNVFAVWLTLGYFEVEKISTTELRFLPTDNPSDFEYQLQSPNQVMRDRAWNRFNAVYPDGYRLKKEVGLETGEIKRHRAFYILDRSIPFGYRRGQKLNSEDAILLKRFIE